MTSDTAEKAERLVAEYARLQDVIHGARKTIGDSLHLCPGVAGFLHEEEDVAGTEWDGSCKVPTERAEKDVTHLSQWYSADADEYERRVYPEPTEAECPHCWAAHQAVQKRKRDRKALGSIKGQIRKLGRKLQPVQP